MYRLALCCLLLPSFALADDITAAQRIGLDIGPDTTVITGPLNEFGYPNHLRYLDQQMSAGVSTDENFWAGMWQACGNMDHSSPEFIQQVEARLGVSIGTERRLLNLYDIYGSEGSQEVYDTQAAAWERPWTRDEFPEVADLLERNADELALVHQACTRPKAYSPLIAGGDYEATPMIAVLLPNVQQSREVARQLVARAYLRMGEGDQAGAWDDLLACHRLAHQLGKGWTMIERLVGIAIHAVAHDPTAVWLSQSTLPPDELLARWEELAPALEPITFAECVNVGERYMFVDTVLALQTGRVESRELFGLMEPTPVSDGGDKLFETDIIAELSNARYQLFDLVLYTSDINETLRYGNRMHDDFYQIMLSPDHQERLARLSDPEGALAENAQIINNPQSLLAEYFLSSDEDFEVLPARIMTGMLMPAIKQCEEAQTRMQGKAVALQAAFAVKIAFELTGEIADDIGSLRDLGEFVPPIPLDPYTENDLLILEDARGVLIYSVGTDGQDDQGYTYGDHPEEGSVDYDDQRAILTIVR